MKTHAVVLFVLLLSLPRPVGAYILSADFLMRLLADARREAPRSVTLTLNSEMTGRDHPVEERLYLKRPERMRLVQMDDTVLVTVAKEGIGAAGEEHAVKPMGPARNLLAALLYPRGRDLDEISARLLRALNTAGIDTRVVSLGRNEEQIVYIVGAQPWETERPQVWLDKGTFLPVRTRLPAPAAAAGKAPIVELRFLEYGAGAVPGLPRVFEELQDGVVMRHAEVVSGVVQGELPESLFDLAGAPARRR